MPTAPAKQSSHTKPKTAHVVLTGNPNCGKTTLFNALTGLRARVGNYAGVTVERKEGRLLSSPPDLPILLLDLPGTYSLSPKSLDEEISRDALLGFLDEVPAPGGVVVVVDASNLERNLYYATQVIELGYPTLVVLNMVDVAAEIGHEIDPAELSRELGVPVCPTVARSGQGLVELRAKIVELAARRSEMRPEQRLFGKYPPELIAEVESLASTLGSNSKHQPVSRLAEALLLLSDHNFSTTRPERYPEEIKRRVQQARDRLTGSGIDCSSASIEGRYAAVGEIEQRATVHRKEYGATLSDKVDQIVTHRFWGLVIFVAIMAVMFQSIFTLAEHPMGWIEGGIAWLGDQVSSGMPPGDLRSLIVDGIIAGVGAVVVFLPQICLLFLFIGLLEDTGYMARAAFLMDRLMSKVGLHGKSFIPMLSSFACAIPGIMATRTIESRKDRLVTILVAPLMSCSARLPVYTLLIGAAIPSHTVFGFFGLQGLTMLSMYLLGIVVALLMAWIFKKTLLRGETPLLIMELPPYKRPVLKTVLRNMWDRSKIFLQRAGTVILGIMVILWFLATYPRSPEVEQEFAAKRAFVQQMDASGAATAELLEQLENEEAGERLRRSFAGRFGRFIEPAIEPLGFDWKIGIGIVASFAAREVFVSTMSSVYNLAGSDESDEGLRDLTQTLKEQQRADGTTLYTPLLGITLMVFYVFALQCVSTVAVVRRETNSWKWPLFQWTYMGALAWVLAFLTYQGGRLLGWQ